MGVKKKGNIKILSCVLLIKRCASKLTSQEEGFALKKKRLIEKAQSRQF